MKIHFNNIIAIIIGSGIISFGINYFNLANGLAEGGVTGTTILLKYIFDIEPSITNILLNIPLFFIGWRVMSKGTFTYTVIGTFTVSLFLWIFRDFRLELTDSLLASLYAGCTMGLGLGIIFRYGGTTGGVDILVRWFNRAFGWSIGRTFFIFDLIVLGVSLFYLETEKVMYTIVAVFIASRVIEFVQQGAYSGKAAMIISYYNSDISHAISEKMGRGSTFLKCRGSFTRNEKEVLYCAISRNESIKLKEIVRSIDPHAFVTFHDVCEVLGEGFTLDEHKNPLS